MSIIDNLFKIFDDEPNDIKLSKKENNNLKEIIDDLNTRLVHFQQEEEKRFESITNQHSSHVNELLKHIKFFKENFEKLIDINNQNYNASQFYLSLLNDISTLCTQEACIDEHGNVHKGPLFVNIKKNLESRLCKCNSHIKESVLPQGN